MAKQNSISAKLPPLFSLFRQKQASDVLKRGNTTNFSFVFKTRMDYISKTVVPHSENGGGELNIQGGELL